jgi:hypothetical protein
MRMDDRSEFSADPPRLAEERSTHSTSLQDQCRGPTRRVGDLLAGGCS